MEIAIKSECDSRILVYPLIKVLYNYGTVAVYSSNRYLSRLIENEMEGGFRNVRVMINTEADLEAVKESDEYFKDKYDYMIYDNMGAIDYDMLMCIVTNRLSENYVNDLVFIASEDKTKILKFGSPAPALKTEKPAKQPPRKQQANDDEIEANRGFNKWEYEKSDEEKLADMLAAKDLKWCKFPSFEAIELMEGRHKMMIPDDILIKELYRLLGPILSVDERQFTKGARLVDEGSSVISGTDVR